MKKLFLAFVFFVSLAAQAQTKSTLVIQDAKSKKTMLAMPAPVYLGKPAANSNFNQIGSDLFRVIENNLNVSTFFQFLSAKSFLEDTSKTTIKPFSEFEPNGFKFQNWKTIGAEFLIRIGFTITTDQLEIEAYLYSVNKGNQVLGKKYKGKVSTVRTIGHTFSNDVLEALTGEKGPFLSKVVVISDRGGGSWKEVYSMDYDGTNVKKISNHKSIALSPAVSRDGRYIAYTAFTARKNGLRNADLWIYDNKNDTKKILSFKQGINSGANFFPDGNSLLLTISHGTRPDIYKINLAGEVLSRLTNGPSNSMNVEPNLSPDGKMIAFSSNRSGNPMVYTMNVDGSNVQRKTYAGKYNATPSWSPDGKKLAFAGWEDDHFDVFTMNTDGTNMMRITSAKKSNGKWAHHEDPVFSPDGRLLMFTSNRTGSYQIYISNLDGSEERRITFDNFNYYKPRWAVDYNAQP